MRVPRVAGWLRVRVWLIMNCILCSSNKDCINTEHPPEFCVGFPATHNTRVGLSYLLYVPRHGDSMWYLKVHFMFLITMFIFDKVASCNQLRVVVFMLQSLCCWPTSHKSLSHFPAKSQLVAVLWKETPSSAISATTPAPMPLLNERARTVLLWLCYCCNAQHYFLADGVVWCASYCCCCLWYS